MQPPDRKELRRERQAPEDLSQRMFTEWILPPGALVKRKALCCGVASF